jgi:hypothetical protein
MSKLKQVENPVIVVGFNPQPLPDIDNYIEAPKHPANYKVQDTIDKWYANDQPKIMAKLKMEAAFSRFTGYIHSMYAIDVYNKLMFNMSDHELAANESSVAVLFIQWLRGLYDLSKVSILGFRAEQFMQVSGAEAMLHGEVVPANYWSPVPFVDALDPYAQLVEESRRPSLPLQLLLARVGLSYPVDWQLHVDPAVDAKLAGRLAYKFHLFTPPADQSDAFNAELGKLSSPDKPVQPAREPKAADEKAGAEDPASIEEERAADVEAKEIEAGV